MANKKPDAVESASKILGEQVINNKAEIVDKEAWEEYERLNEHPLLNEKRFQTDSLGRNFSLGMLQHQFAQHLFELPEAEQNKFKLLKQNYQRLLAKRNGCLKKAYGTPVKNADGEISQSSVQFNRLDLKRAELIELFGRMFTLKEVHEVCLKQFKLRTTTSSLWEWREKHKDEINARIEEHKRTFSDIRLGYKRSRLEELSWLYKQRKDIYEKTKKGEDHRLLLETLKHIKTEVEGDLIRIDGSLDINLQAQIEDHTRNEVLRHISLQEIILARVCAKLGMPVAEMLALIIKGYYYKTIYTQEVPLQEVSYPSLQTYDFDRIRRQHEQIEHNKQTQKQLEKPKVIDESKAIDIKTILLRKLKQQQEDVNQSKNNMQNYFTDKAND